MSVLIKSLTNGVPPVDDIEPPPLDYFNLLQFANFFYSLYTAPIPPTNRAAIVKSVRIANTHATQSVKITLYFSRPDADGRPRRRLLTPLDMTLAPNSVYIDDSEITLEPGDSIQAKTDTANVVQYVISGLERDAS